MKAEDIKQRLEETAQSKIRINPVEHLSASRLGHPCERYLFLIIKHWEDQIPHDIGLQHIFDLGNSIEDYTIARLKEAGFECITPTVRSWRIEKPLITGREDVRIKDENGNLIPCEIKGLSPIEFDRLNTIDDFFKSKRSYVRGYPAQLFVYMYHFNCDKGFFIITNKLTGEIKAIEVSLDYEYGEQILQKAERIYRAIETGVAPEACDDLSVCENCNLQHVCGMMRRVPADIEVDGELDELIEKKQELAAYKRAYEDVDKAIKLKVGEREKIVTGNYVILRKKIERSEYLVPARTEYRLTVKKL